MDDVNAYLHKNSIDVTELNLANDITHDLAKQVTLFESMKQSLTKSIETQTKQTNYMKEMSYLLNGLNSLKFNEQQPQLGKTSSMNS
jgi:hypothetical protein